MSVFPYLMPNSQEAIKNIQEYAARESIQAALEAIKSIKEAIENKPLFVMFEESLNCDPQTDHQVPKNIYPLFQRIFEQQSRIIQNTTLGKFKSVLQQQIPEVVHKEVERTHQLEVENIKLNGMVSALQRLLNEMQNALNKQVDEMAELKKSLELNAQILKEQLKQTRRAQAYKADYADSKPKEEGEKDEDIDFPEHMTTGQIRAFQKQFKQNQAYMNDMRAEISNLGSSAMLMGRELQRIPSLEAEIIELKKQLQDSMNQLDIKEQIVQEQADQYENYQTSAEEAKRQLQLQINDLMRQLDNRKSDTQFSRNQSNSVLTRKQSVVKQQTQEKDNEFSDIWKEKYDYLKGQYEALEQANLDEAQRHQEDYNVLVENLRNKNVEVEQLKVQKIDLNKQVEAEIMNENSRLKNTIKQLQSSSIQQEFVKSQDENEKKNKEIQQLKSEINKLKLMLNTQNSQKQRSDRASAIQSNESVGDMMVFEHKCVQTHDLILPTADQTNLISESERIPLELKQQQQGSEQQQEDMLGHQLVQQQINSEDASILSSQESNKVRNKTKAVVQTKQQQQLQNSLNVSKKSSEIGLQPNSSSKIKHQDQAIKPLFQNEPFPYKSQPKTLDDDSSAATTARSQVSLVSSMTGKAPSLNQYAGIETDSLNQEIKKLNQTIERKDKEINNYQNELLQKDHVIGQLEEEILRLQQLIAKYQETSIPYDLVLEDPRIKDYIAGQIAINTEKAIQMAILKQQMNQIEDAQKTVQVFQDNLTSPQYVKIPLQQRVDKISKNLGNIENSPILEMETTQMGGHSLQNQIISFLGKEMTNNSLSPDNIPPSVSLKTRDLIIDQYQQDNQRQLQKLNGSSNIIHLNSERQQSSISSKLPNSSRLDQDHGVQGAKDRIINQKKQEFSTAFLQKAMQGTEIENNYSMKNKLDNSEIIQLTNTHQRLFDVQNKLKSKAQMLQDYYRDQEQKSLNRYLASMRHLDPNIIDTKRTEQSGLTTKITLVQPDGTKITQAEQQSNMQLLSQNQSKLQQLTQVNENQSNSVNKVMNNTKTKLGKQTKGQTIAVVDMNPENIEDIFFAYRNQKHNDQMIYVSNSTNLPSLQIAKATPNGNQIIQSIDINSNQKPSTAVKERLVNSYLEEMTIQQTARGRDLLRIKFSGEEQLQDSRPPTQLGKLTSNE